MNTPFIEFRHVHFAYSDRPILKDLNISIEQGRFVAIMGGSGSGKTTVLRLISRQLQPKSGQVLINGKDLASFSETELYEHRRKMGVLFQFGALFTDLSIFENIAFPIREHSHLPEKMIRDLVLLKLNAVGLRGIEESTPSDLSGGMARRVALARTIALDPSLMLYDEPFTGLDPISLGVIAHLIARINRALEATSVMVTHDLTKSLDIVDQVIFLSEGQIKFDGTPTEFKQDNSPWVKQFFNGLPDGPVEYRFPNVHSLTEDLLQRESIK
ncbi:ABC transporter ATP-binding protein [Neisseria sp. Ec49-e6-T10]|uniref:ABC transporter ATP-binding protein n=1 Tax=Neisseria sp. Ec49-e6-T10 TaxID=3140744 RepID=UPI003EBC8572